MDTYKFKTIVKADGVIKIPELKEYKDQEVEVFLVFKNEQDQEYSAEDFIAKWKGFLSNIDADEQKMNYLLNKHS